MDLMEAQRDLEQRSTAEGYARYLKQHDATVRNEGAYATKEATKVIKGSLPLVTKVISQWLLDNKKGKGEGKSHVAHKTLSQLDPDMLAYVALNGVFSGITHDHPVAAVQVHIGTTLETEVIALAVEAQRDAKTLKRIQAYTSRQGSSRNRKKVFDKLVKANDIQHDDWTQEFKLKVGEPLVNAVLLALPDIFELHTVYLSGRDSKVIVRLTDEGTRLLASIHDSIAWLQPVHRPMVVKPRPWTDFSTGCYYDEKAARTVKLVRTYDKDHKRLVQDAIKAGTMDYVLESLNAIQETPWAINKPVLEVFEWAYTNKVKVPGMPRLNLMDLPPKMEPEVWNSMTEQQRKGVKINLSSIREMNRGVASDTMVFLRDLDTAKELSKYDRFYIPHNLDFRGRVYPVCHFSQQRSDHIKGLLQFADGVPLGEYGGSWLAIHLANCGDFNKVSKADFDTRIQWVNDNEQLILDIAADPYGTVDRWGDADSPFMFLAACLDYAGWINSGRSVSYVSRLAVALDGSNSGLQHYSAAMRCEEEAALVSLIPNDKPSDLYQTVADFVMASAKEDAASGDPVASLCVSNGIGRSLVKRNVMTFAYSSEQYGFRQQLMSDTMRPLDMSVITGQLKAHPYAMVRADGSLDGGFAASGYLAKKVWQGVTSVVKRASEGMEFFQQVAAALAHEGHATVWTTPIGLPVIHKYEEWNVKRVNTNLYDRAMPVVEATKDDRVVAEGVLRRVRANIRTTPTGKIDRNKARSAIAPNVIHSMDSSHMMLTVLAAKEEGVHHYALIHDSFGTHAGRTAEFFQTIRQSFVDMYDNYCPFEEVLGYAQGVLSDETQDRLPALPEKGNMDLNVVNDALYAFA